MYGPEFWSETTPLGPTTPRAFYDMSLRNLQSWWLNSSPWGLYKAPSSQRWSLGYWPLSPLSHAKFNRESTVIKGCALRHVDIKFPWCVQSFWLILAHAANSDAQDHLTRCAGPLKAVAFHFSGFMYLGDNVSIHIAKWNTKSNTHILLLLVVYLGVPKCWLAWGKALLWSWPWTHPGGNGWRAGRRAGTWDSGRPGSPFWLSLLFTVWNGWCIESLRLSASSSTE